MTKNRRCFIILAHYYTKHNVWPRVKTRIAKTRTRRQERKRRARVDPLLILASLTPLVVLILVLLQIRAHPHSELIKAELTFPREVILYIPYSVLEPKFVTLLTSLVALLVLPIALREYRYQRLVCSIEEQIPTVIRIVSSVLRTGGTLNRAIEIVATSAIKPSNMIFAKAIALSRLSAIPLLEAIRRIGQDMRIEALIRLADILELATRYGAHLEETLDLTAKILESFESFRKERRTNVGPYVVLIYVIVVVYIFMCDIIAVMSFGLAGMTSVKYGLAAATNYKLYSLVGICLYTLVIQLFASSLIIGRVIYDRPSCGLIHFVVLTLMSTALTYTLLHVLKMMLATGMLPT